MSLRAWADDSSAGEFVDGRRTAEEAPSFLHDAIATWLLVAFHTWLKGHGIRRTRPFRVRTRTGAGNRLVTFDKRTPISHRSPPFDSSEPIRRSHPHPLEQTVRRHRQRSPIGDRRKDFHRLRIRPRHGRGFAFFPTKLTSKNDRIVLDERNPFAEGSAVLRLRPRFHGSSLAPPPHEPQNHSSNPIFGRLSNPLRDTGPSGFWLERHETSTLPTHRQRFDSSLRRPFYSPPIMPMPRLTLPTALRTALLRSPRSASNSTTSSYRFSSTARLRAPIVGAPYTKGTATRPITSGPPLRTVKSTGTKSSVAVSRASRSSC